MMVESVRDVLMAALTEEERSDFADEDLVTVARAVARQAKSVLAEHDRLRDQVRLLGEALQRQAYTDKDVAKRDAEIERLRRNAERDARVVDGLRGERITLWEERDKAATALAAIKDWKWERPPTPLERIELVASELKIARDLVAGLVDAITGSWPGWDSKTHDPLVLARMAISIAGRWRAERDTAQHISGVGSQPDNEPGEPCNEDVTAMEGVSTPGCDCGHSGMAAGWHSSDCAWIRTPITEQADSEPLQCDALGEGVCCRNEGHDGECDPGDDAPPVPTEPRVWQKGDEEPPVGTTIRLYDGTTRTRYELGWYPGPWNWSALSGRVVEVVVDQPGGEP